MSANSTSIKKHHKAIILSDVHLGTASSKAKEVVQFLIENTCDTLILNGDIIDAWELKKYGSWKVKHTRFWKIVLRMMEQNNTKVYYLHGNHDDFLDTIIPLQIGNMSIQMDLVYESMGKRYYVVHGDIFDSVTTHLKWIAQLGSIGYTFLLWLNRLYNIYRKKRGLPYYSFSKYIKTKVKSAVSRASAYEKQLTELAKSKHCLGVICGHTHKPDIKFMGDILYMNSGDWVESMTALTEDFEGNWHLYAYTDDHVYDVESDRSPDSDQEVEIDQLQSFYFASWLKRVKSL